MRLKLNCDRALRDCIMTTVADILGIELGDGIEVNFTKGERLGASLCDGVGTVYYKKRHHLFRELSLFVENAKKSDSFDLTERDDFDTMGVMITATGSPVPSVCGVKNLLNHLALMGYGMAMLYTENTIELKSRKFFGYMAGRYTESELRDIDDYAYSLGIEMIPCLECYGHMGAYLLWDEASNIKDTDNVLLAREEETFEFLDELIRTASAPYRSKRIHIGMDEAHGMGTGAFLKKHGYVPALQIFDEFMERLAGITDKYGLIPMMWSDMYFRNSSCRGDYYDVNAKIPDSTKQMIPKGVQLVFWHYGECWNCDEEMIRLHRELERDVIFAGATWGWAGHFADHIFARETMKKSLSACRKCGVREMINTYWSKGDALPAAQLLALSDAAELCYHENPDEEHFKSRFECISGADYGLFALSSLYHNDEQTLLRTLENENGDRRVHTYRFIGQQLFWQDILYGMYDAHLFEHPMSAHYREVAERASAYKNPRWQYFYDYVCAAFSYLALKCEIAEKLQPAYKSGDSATLAVIKDDLLPRLIALTDQLHECHRVAWFKECRAANWQGVDIRYAGVKARCTTAIMRLSDYLSGEIREIDELEEQRYKKGTSGFDSYMRIVSPTRTL